MSKAHFKAIGLWHRRAYNLGSGSRLSRERLEHRKVLRLKGKGVGRRDGSRGDEYVTLKIVLPEHVDPELKRFASEWVAGKQHNPRRAIGLNQCVYRAVTA